MMDSEKNHSIKHGSNAIAKYADCINMGYEAPEDAHKFKIKEPGGCTNQGSEAVLTTMSNARQTKVSALLCDGRARYIFLLKYLKTCKSI